MGGYLVPTYVFYLRRYLFPNRLRMIAGTDPGTSTRPELPGSVPDFFAGSNLYWFWEYLFVYVVQYHTLTRTEYARFLYYRDFWRTLSFRPNTTTLFTL